MEEEEAPAPQPGPTLLTTELVAVNLSVLEEVVASTEGKEQETGSTPEEHPDGCCFAYTKCELGASQCEVEAAADAFESYKHLRYLSLSAPASWRAASPLLL